MNAARGLVMLAVALMPSAALASAVPLPLPLDPIVACRSADTLRTGWCLRQLAHSLEAAGESAPAERCWRALAALPSIWQWEATAALSRLAAERGDGSAAESLVTAADVRPWPPDDRAARLGRLAALRAADGDTLAALAACRQAMRAFPSAPASRAVLALFDTLAAARGDSVPFSGQSAAAEVEFWSGARSAAIERLGRLFRSRASAGPLERWRAGLRLAEMQRIARRLPAARATLDALVGDDQASARVWLERARVLRDQGMADAAYAAYAQAARLSSESSEIETAWWEAGREAEERGEWRRAAGAYRQIEATGPARASNARFRLALIDLSTGRPAAARQHLARLPGEAARFWWAIAARDSDRAASDSALATLARQPGYAFYRAAARESLGLAAGEPVVAAPPPGDGPTAGLDLVAALIRLGFAADARSLLDRWSADDPRAGAPRDSLRHHPWLMLRAAELEDRLGRPRESIHLAERAAQALADSTAQAQWRAIAAIYPPRFDALIDTALADPRVGVEGALMRGLIWQESHFDSGAISRSGAVGLSQLMPATAAEMARRLGDPLPTDSALADPALNVRYGARHLALLLDQFGGHVPRALAAYNAGAPAVRRWAGRLPEASDALFSEMIPYAETRDYVKRILGARQAYRERTLPLPATTR